MITSLDNLANAAVQKNDTVEHLVLANKLLMDTIAKLSHHHPTISRAQAHSPSPTIAKCQTKVGPQGIYFTPGCTNPPNLNNTALLDTAANISLLTPTAPALHDATPLPVKTIIQPSCATLTTSGNVFLSLPKLPQSAKQAYQISGLTNNLLSAAVLADAGCEVFFHHTGCKVSYSGEIIMQGWRDPTTRLWQVPIHSMKESIMPSNDTIISFTEPTPQAHTIYECKNTDQLINFYYTTMGYPAVATWCKAIDKGYFRGWNCMTSERVCSFVKPSEFHVMGHLDQWRQGIHSTKSALATITLEPMEALPQLPLNDKIDMVFMTMVDIQGQLFTDQAGHFPVSSIRGNNYIVIFYTVDANHIKSCPIKSHHRTELLCAYNELYAYLCMREYRSQLHKLNNKSSRNVETFITENNASFQYTPPEIH
ncbi:hypothetical protein ACHAW6_005313 [Cyclotella cf. meneghiniana]